MRKARQADLAPLLEFLKADILNCIYMYINLKVYGISNPNVEVWLEETPNGIEMAAMRYYDALRFYCRFENDDTFKGITKLAEETKHKLLYTSYSMAQRIYEAFPGLYCLEKSVAVKLDKYRNFDFSKVEIAEEKDVKEIVSLILDDDFYRGQYDPNGLEQEIVERMRTGMGRNFIIRQDERIVAHGCISAETDDVAVGSLLICHRDYRNRFLSEILENYIIKTLCEEGKSMYGFILEERRLKMLERLHNTLTACYGKLTRI